METEARRAAFPYLPTKNWWDLRRRFRASPPREVTTGYLADVLSITERAAMNLLPSLRRLGLIDENGRPTERAMAWRDDERYQEATNAMIADAYPSALVDVAPPPDPDTATARRWFARETGRGEAYARQLASFYALLARGDASGEAAGQRPAATGRTPAPRGRSSTRHPRPSGSDRDAVGTSGAGQRRAAPNAHGEHRQASGGEASDTNAWRRDVPSVHIDIQVHINPASTAEQIDQIFASMARHLYGKE